MGRVSACAALFSMADDVALRVSAQWRYAVADLEKKNMLGEASIPYFLPLYSMLQVILIFLESQSTSDLTKIIKRITIIYDIKYVYIQRP